MPIEVNYGSPAAAGMAALAAGQGQRAERDLDRQREDAARAQQMQAQQQSQIAQQQHDINRAMLGAQVENAQSMRDFALSRYAKKEDVGMAMTAEEQQSQRDLNRRKEMMDYNAGLERQEMDARMNATDRAEANKIQNDIRAIEGATNLGAEQKQQLIDQARIKDASLRSRVASQQKQVPPRFVDMPARRQPGQPPWTPTDEKGAPMMREVFDDQGNPTGKKEPVMMITDENGIPKPWEDPVAKANAANAAKARANKLKADTELKTTQMEAQAKAEDAVVKRFESFSDSYKEYEVEVDRDGKKVKEKKQRTPEEIMTEFRNREKSRAEVLKEFKGGGAGQPAAAAPPKAQEIMKQTGQQAPLKIQDPKQIEGLAPGTVVSIDGKTFAVPPRPQHSEAGRPVPLTTAERESRAAQAAEDQVRERMLSAKRPGAPPVHVDFPGRSNPDDLAGAEGNDEIRGAQGAPGASGQAGTAGGMGTAAAPVPKAPLTGMRKTFWERWLNGKPGSKQKKDDEAWLKKQGVL